MIDIKEILRNELLSVNNAILDQIQSDEEIVETVSKYLINSGGKRIRPALTILTCKLFGYEGEDVIKLAASIEFIHAATLLHDDVVDSSTMRRFKETANVIWGNQTSILVGDFLFAQSFKLMISAGSMEAMRILSETLSIVVEGEVEQLWKLKEKRIINSHEYNKIINAKTAKLFGAACEVGAVIAGQDKKTLDSLRGFGEILGSIFQIADDILDYVGDSSIGKNIGDDFMEGKITLPVILAYNLGSDDEKDFWRNALFSQIKNQDEFKTATALLHKYNIPKLIRDNMNILIDKGKKQLQLIQGDKISREHMESLLYYAASRQN